MCGIVTQFSRNGRTVKEDALWRAVHELHHRGPDGHHIWLAPHERVGMGHVRLSIIDLATGDQPLSNEDGQIHAVVNGEFYDYEPRAAATSDTCSRSRACACSRKPTVFELEITRTRGLS